MLLLNKKIFLYIILIIPFQSYPQVIKEVTVSGNSAFSIQNVIEWSQLKSGARLKENILDTAEVNILKSLAQRGYFSASADIKIINSSKDTSFVDLQINLKEGNPAFIQRVEVQSSDSSDFNYPDLFSFLVGQICFERVIGENINNWLSSVENKGYPFARAVITSVDIIREPGVDNYAHIIILVDRGMESRINKISISGNESTKDYVIIRELRLNRNQIYSQQQVEEFPARLNRLRFFEPVQVPEFFLNKDNEGVLLINVKEKQTNNFDGIIGYIPPVGEQQTGYLTGLVNVSLRNLFGTGRAAAVRWQQYDRHSQELELRYIEPWIFTYPFNISGGLFQRKQDTTYIQRKLDGAIEFLATEDISAGVSVSTESVIPTLSDNLRFTVYNSNALTTGLNLKIDTRDDPYAPLSGLLFLNSYSFSRKKIYGPDQFITPGTNTSLNFQRITADLSVFYQILSRQVIAIGIHGRELRGSSFEESDLFRLGGTNTLRGYRENQYLGSRILWTNLEYRLLLTRRTFAFLFFDSGYYQRKEEIARGIPGIQAYKSGYGAGINLETGIGVLAVSYALAAGDSFSDGKIHFGIVNEF